MQRQYLLDELRSMTLENKATAQDLRRLPMEQLNKRASPESWSALECIEHLNRYGDYYLPEIEHRILKAGQSPQATTFRPSWLGNYFAKAVAPLDQGAKPMKTFKSMNPAGSQLPIHTLDKFIKQQDRTLALLQDSEKVDLTRTRTNISISKLIKLRLGDTYRVLIYHNCRHVGQALRACGIEMFREDSSVK